MRLEKEINNLIKGIHNSSVNFNSSEFCTEVLEELNVSNYLIKVHDVEQYMPICMNNLMREFYGFDSNVLKGSDYLNYLKLMHPTTLNSLANCFTFYRTGAKGFLKVDYILKNNNGQWKKLKCITKTIHKENGVSKYALTVAKISSESVNSTLMKVNQLTKREVDVVKLLTIGYTQKQAADSLNIAYSTVHSHVKSVYKKLEINKISELISIIEKYPLV